MNLVNRYQRFGLWNNGEKRSCNLTDFNIKTIERVSLFSCVFHFKEMTDRQRDYILRFMNTHNVSNLKKGTETLSDFFELLNFLKLDYDLTWRWNGPGLINNLKAYYAVKKFQKILERERIGSL